MVPEKHYRPLQSEDLLREWNSDIFDDIAVHPVAVSGPFRPEEPEVNDL
jgi:hypothetical protein